VNEALDIARQWAARGVPAFPYAVSWDEAKGKTNKRPLTHHGVYSASIDDDELVRLFTEPEVRPRAGEVVVCGLLPGRAGYVVTDIDVPLGLVWVEATDLQQTYTVQTASGGLHRWERKLVDAHVGSRPMDGAEGVDIRGDVGGVVAPGSSTPWGEWVSHDDFENDVAVMEPWQWALLTVTSEGEVQAHTETAKARAVQRAAARASGEPVAVDPIDDYKERAEPEEVVALLVEAGWAYVGLEDGVHYVRRPGKRSGWSGTVGFAGPGLFCWSDSPDCGPFAKGPGGNMSSPAYVLRHVRYAGDLAVTRTGLAARGFGKTGVRGVRVRGLAEDVPTEWNDSALGVALADHLRGKWLYVEDLRTWRQWDGRRWADAGLLAVYEVARKWVDDIIVALVRAPGNHGALIKRAMHYKGTPALGHVVTTAMRILLVKAEVFDRHPHVMNVGNGVIDLRTEELRPHDPTLLLTRLTPVDHVPGATHPDVDAVLKAVDTEVETSLRQFYGAAAHGTSGPDAMLVLDGYGSNGKTTLQGMIMGALGDYAEVVPTELVMQTARDDHKVVFMTLLGLRAAFIAETAEEGGLRIERMKRLTGGDKIEGRPMYGKPVTFEPTHLLTVATNHRPVINSGEPAVWRRLHLVPFPHRYGTEPDDWPIDYGLRDRVRRGRAQREAALAWVVRGAVEFHQNDSQIEWAPQITAATEAWKQAEDVTLRFMLAKLVPDPEARGKAAMKASDLYLMYENWCRNEEGRPAAQHKNFLARLRANERWTRRTVERLAQRAVVFDGVRKREPLDDAIDSPDQAW
jgi:putative DNA primase/helicase